MKTVAGGRPSRRSAACPRSSLKIASERRWESLGLLQICGLALLLICVAAVSAQQPAAQPPAAAPAWVPVRPIEPPATPLPPETASAAVTKFSFIGYGDTRSSGQLDIPGDGEI